VKFYPKIMPASIWDATLLHLAKYLPDKKKRSRFVCCAPWRTKKVSHQCALPLWAHVSYFIIIIIIIIIIL
jgi:hypothetical protein